MKFYYTGAPEFNKVQPLASLSLGGFMSSSEIQNDVLNNIFGDVSELAKQNLTRKAILIALKNDAEDLAEDITLEFDATWTNLISQFSIAFVSPKTDSCGDIFFDKINDSGALPYVSFDVLSSINNSFNLGVMHKEKVIGIWLVRDLIKAKVAPLANQTLIDNYNNNAEVADEEDFSISLTWNEDISNSSSSSVAL